MFHIITDYSVSLSIIIIPLDIITDYSTLVKERCFILPSVTSDFNSRLKREKDGAWSG